MNEEKITAYVSLGSNLGNRAGNLLLAVRGLLEASFMVRHLSAIYETEPVGIESNDNFLNMVAEIEVENFTSEQMLARMLRIEYLLGRRRYAPKAPRTVDLDLLLFGDEIHSTEFLILPHPLMHERNFVLVPLNEIAPLSTNPVLKQTANEMLKNSPDTSRVKRWKPT